jgi:hypothetical protein
MILSYLLSGNAPVKKKFQIGETWGDAAGFPVEYPTLADATGVLMCETNACVDTLGVTVDKPHANNGRTKTESLTRLTAQQTDGSDPSQVVTVIVNPGAVWKARVNSGATEGTALAEFTNSAASTDGLLITSAFGTGYDDGWVVGATGANAGIARKIQGAVNTTGTPIIAFPYDIAVGDTFYAFTFGPGEDAGIQLTTLLTELDATADLQSTDNIRCLDIYFKDKAAGGATKTEAEVMLIDHVYGGNIT